MANCGLLTLKPMDFFLWFSKSSEVIFFYVRILTAYLFNYLIFKRRIKSHLPFAGIIRSSPYSPRFQDKG